MREAAERARENFNAWHAPEAMVEILDVGEKRVTIRVRGTACRACGFDERVFDYAYLLQDILGNNVQVKVLKQEGDSFWAELVVEHPSRDPRAQRV